MLRIDDTKVANSGWVELRPKVRGITIDLSTWNLVNQRDEMIFSVYEHTAGGLELKGTSTFRNSEIVYDSSAGILWAQLKSALFPNPGVYYGKLELYKDDGVSGYVKGIDPLTGPVERLEIVNAEEYSDNPENWNKS